MIFLLLAIVTSTSIIILFKFFEKFRIVTLQALITNYLIAVLLGYFSISETFAPVNIFQKSWLAISFVSGFLLIATFFVYAYSVRKAGMAVTSVAGKMSVVIPVLSGFVLFHEYAGWIRVSGIIIALVAFYLTLKPSAKNKTNIKYLFLPFLLFIGNGMNDTVFNIAQELYIRNDFTEFLTACFFVSFCIGMFVLLIQFIINKQKIHPISILAGVILGILNWYSTYFFLKGLSVFDVSVFVPVFNACIVTLSALIGFFIFREKLSKQNIAGIILAVLAILFIAGSS